MLFSLNRLQTKGLFHQKLVTKGASANTHQPASQRLAASLFFPRAPCWAPSASGEGARSVLPTRCDATRPKCCASKVGDLQCNLHATPFPLKVFQ